MDTIDRAQEREQLDRELALRAHSERPPQAASTGICCDCPEPIDARRLAANPNATRCIDCRLAADKRARLFGKRGA